MGTAANAAPQRCTPTRGLPTTSRSGQHLAGQRAQCVRPPGNTTPGRPPPAARFRRQYESGGKPDTSGGGSHQASRDACPPDLTKAAASVRPSSSDRTHTPEERSAAAVARDGQAAGSDATMSGQRRWKGGSATAGSDAAAPGMALAGWQDSPTPAKGSTPGRGHATRHLAGRTPQKKSGVHENR